MEEMKKEDFLKIMDLLDGAYPTFKITDNVLKTYYYFLKHYDKKMVWKICAKWITENEYAPTIKTLIDLLERHILIENLEKAPLSDEGYQE